MSDLINRQMAYNTLTEYYHHKTDIQHKALQDALKRVPPAEPDLSEYSTWFRIGETLVDESKMHITAERAIDKIRGYMIRMKKPEQRWIPCSERLPKEEKRHYWVCTDTGYQCQCRWTNDVYGLGASDRWEWKIFDIPQYQKVIAWMPLPEPYTERRTDGD